MLPSSSEASLDAHRSHDDFWCCQHLWNEAADNLLMCHSQATVKLQGFCWVEWHSDFVSCWPTHKHVQDWQRTWGVPKAGCFFKPGCLHYLCGSFALFCALLRSFVYLCLCSFVPFAYICVILRPTAFRAIAFGNFSEYWPPCRIRIFCDRRGNWFAEISRHSRANHGLTDMQIGLAGFSIEHVKMQKRSCNFSSFGFEMHGGKRKLLQYSASDCDFMQLSVQI